MKPQRWIPLVLVAIAVSSVIGCSTLQTLLPSIFGSPTATPTASPSAGATP